MAGTAGQAPDPVALLDALHEHPERFDFFDAVRRIERGAFSPSLDTLRKLCLGLDISFRTLFQGFERQHRDHVAEICDFLESRSQSEVQLAWRVVRAMFDDRS